MRVSIRVVGVAGVAVLSMLAAGSVALADSANNDGINTAEGLNTITAPVQNCSNSVLGPALAHIMSPQSNKCVNAPLIDHPKVEG
jgi:hypothetical protein